MDAGHKVYQVSQTEKDAVPDEVRKAAREMGEKAFKERCQLHPLECFIICCTSIKLVEFIFIINVMLNEVI